ncbi:PAS domain-containing protein [Actinoplanes bogorensis]|uniref:PAS domain-containing protein n=1 Tax=Paractinoplanes bogorensis TaxID=1610840 RepID=A0ABS5Z2V4_9ACTN|nr:PAS domain-containing protein [Actinoplanes bogorensis]MBU2670030.1 PAS domain-containing protein [Actinoplanes bogorensis]
MNPARQTSTPDSPATPLSDAKARATSNDLVGHEDSEVLPEAVAAAGRRHDQQAWERGEAVTALEELRFADEIRQYVCRARC